MSIQVDTVLCGMIGENAYVVRAEGREDCVVVDPGDDYPKIKRALGERRVAAILLTHGHFDHIMAVGELARETGAPVYIREEDMEMIHDAELNGRAGLMGVGTMAGLEFEAQPFGEKLSVAGMDFEILHTPGHSKGSACLYLPEEDTLFSGDTLFRSGYGRLDLHGGSPAQMIESLRRLFGLPDHVRVYPGHGGVTTIGRERSLYRL